MDSRKMSKIGPDETFWRKVPDPSEQIELTFAVFETLIELSLFPFVLTRC